MIRIYSREEFKDMVDWDMIDSDAIDGWDFPIEELDYLLEEHDEESFVLIDNRLYEINKGVE